MRDPALWIFGYGSLVWRPAFAHRERRPAWIRGFARRFWQGSTDHRGVPGAPGRVVTLVRDRTARCGGVAYRIDPADALAVLAQLDHREKGGYERAEVDLHFGRDGPPAGVSALVYIATESNPNYLGPAPLPSIAGQVKASVGPSGPNREYVLRLAQSLRSIGDRDDHVFALASLVGADAESAA
ncbi:MAG: gamma-glutamylcyclotransferase [Myxococcota bacterium]